MTYRVLYYPYYEPSPVWLRRILLFVDGVDRIIPRAANYRDSEHVEELRAVLAPKATARRGEDAERKQAISRLDPVHYNLSLKDADRQRMKMAFEMLASSAQKSPRSKGKKQTAPFRTVMIYKGKIDPEIRSFLKHYKLINSKPTKEERGQMEMGYLSVHEGAADLIMSYLANRIAQNEGEDAITDQQVGFTVNALDNLRISTELPSGTAEGSLLASIASCEIPAEIHYLSLTAYKEIRESYSGIRKAFQVLTEELARVNRLTQIENPKTFKNRLEETVGQFVDEVDSYRRSKTAQVFKKWLPLTIGGLIGVLTVPVKGPLAFVMGVKASDVALKVIDKKINQDSIDPQRKRTYQMLCGLRKAIINKSLTKTFLHLHPPTAKKRSRHD